MAILTIVRWYLIVVLIFISLIINVEHFFHVFVGHLYVLYVWRKFSSFFLF